MVSFSFWIKSSEAHQAAGPLTFPELRELMQSGLVTGDTLLADDDFLYHPLRDFTSLWEALNDPSVDDVVRVPATKMAWREEIVRERDTNTAAPILNPKPDDVIDFEAVRRGERGFAAFDVLALNRSKEPEKVVKRLPWHRESWVVNTKRWAFVCSPYMLTVLIFLPGAIGGNAGDWVVIGMCCCILGGVAWHVFVVDAHWHGNE